MKKLFASLVLLAALPVQAAPPSKVQAQVLQVDVKMTEEQIALVQLSGLVKNATQLPVRGLQVRVRLLDPEQKTLRTFLLPAVPQLDAGKTEYFSAAQILRDQSEPFIRATAQVEYDNTSYIQIADWVMAQSQDKLAVWNIPVAPQALNDERQRVETALGFLTQVENSEKNYPEARRKWNLIQYNYGKRLAESHDLHEAILRFSNVEPTSEYRGLAQEWLTQVRPQAIFERAMAKAVAGNLRGAVRQMQYLPAGTPLAAQGQVKSKQWLDTLTQNKVKLGPIDPPASLSPDQRNVWLRRQHGPEGNTTTVREGKTYTTWWYLDYSHFTFDPQGKLVNAITY